MSDKYKATTGQQFFHIETYAKKPSRNSAIQKNKIKQKRGRRSKKDQIKLENHNKKERLSNTVSRQRKVQDVLKEVMRVNGYCNHVENPESPTVIYGMDIPTLELTIENIYATAKTLVAKKDGDLAARKIRPDQHVLLAGVASHPRRSEDYKNDPEIREMIDLWIDDTIEFLQKKYGDRLKSVVLHVDEKHVHVHFYCVENMYEQVISGTPTKIFVPVDHGLHDGKTAQRQVENSDLKGTKKVKLKQEVYAVAMSALQDDFHQNVSSVHGHERTGPRRKRFKTGAEYRSYLADQEQLENAKFLERKADESKKQERNKLSVEIKDKVGKLHKLDNVIIPAKIKEANTKINKQAKEYKNKKINQINKEVEEIKHQKESEIDALNQTIENLETHYKGEKSTQKAKIIKELNEFENTRRQEIIDKTEFEKSEIAEKIDELADSIIEKGDRRFVSFKKESKDVITLQQVRINELKNEVIEANRKERKKGIENNELKKEKNSISNKLNTLEKSYNRLEKKHNSLVKRFNYLVDGLEVLYRDGKDAFDNMFSSIKYKFKKVFVSSFDNKNDH